MKRKTNTISFIIQKAGKKMIAGIAAASLIISGNISTVLAEEIVVENNSDSSEEISDSSAMNSVADEDYTDLVEGALSKSDLEYVLGILPWYMNENGWEDYDHNMPYLINEMIMNASYTEASPITVLGEFVWSASDITRVFSSFSNLVFSEDNIAEINTFLPMVVISGDQVSFTPASPSRNGYAQITSAEYSGDQMIIHFLLTQDSVDYGVFPNMPQKAILQMSDSGKYKIIAIEDENSLVNVESLEPENMQKDQMASEDLTTQEDTTMQGATDGFTVDETLGEAADVIVENQSGESDVASETISTPSSDMVSAYSAILDSVQDGSIIIMPANDSLKSTSEGCEYFIQDLDQDGIPELIIGELFTSSVFYYHAVKIFSLQQTDDGYTTTEIPIAISVGENGTAYFGSLLIPGDGIGLYENIVGSRGTGAAEVYLSTMQNGTFVQQTETVLSYTLGDDIFSLLPGTAMVEWTPVADRSALG